MNEITLSLAYPFDIDKISVKKSKWVRELSKNDNLAKKKVAILGGSTTNEIKELLRLFGLSNGFDFEFFESSHDRWYESSMFEDEELKSFEGDIFYLYITSKNIQNMPKVDSAKDDAIDALEQNSLRVFSAIDALSKRYSKPIIINNFEYPLTRALGNLDRSALQGKSPFIDSLNRQIAGFVSQKSGVYLCDINYLSAFVGLRNWYDERLWHSYRLATSFEGAVYLAKEVSSIISAICGKTKKCLVLDLDNTLWGGVIGDDGADGIKLSCSDNEGEPFSAFQSECKELSKRGIMLSIASKNEYKNALEGLRKEEMILKEDDFVSKSISWEPKNLALQKIASELNIGIDSLVFADDNPAERHIISSSLPMVGVIKMPESPSEYLLALDRSGFFETISLTSDDANRVRFYIEDKKREEIKSTFADYGEYLESLNMMAKISKVDDESLERVAQLINKTNQFNMTMKRTAESEIKSVKNSKKHILLNGRLSDRFGDNGLVSVIGGEMNGDTIRIVWWVMSCRVFARDFEHVMFEEFIKSAKECGIKRVVGVFVEGPKNQMLDGFYTKLGFAMEGKGEFGLDIDSYVPKKYYIEVEK